MKKKYFITIAFLMIFLSACGIPSANNTGSGAESVDFSGEWSDEAGGSIVIDMWRDESGRWYGEISRSDTDYQASFWSFSGNAEGSVIKYDDMSCIRGIYDEEGEVTEEAVYENGSGSISITDGKMSWQDDVEGAGACISFIYSGEY